MKATFEHVSIVVAIRAARWIESHPALCDLRAGPLGSLLIINV